MLQMTLEFLSLAITGMLAGALMYCAHVEVGARKLMQPQEKLANWRLAFPLASSMFKPLSLLATIVLIANGYVSSNWMWYLSAVFTFVLTPVTILLIAPINTKLESFNENTTDQEITSLINAWAMRHNIRSACTSIAFIITIYTSVSH